MAEISDFTFDDSLFPGVEAQPTVKPPKQPSTDRKRESDSTTAASDDYYRPSPYDNSQAKEGFQRRLRQKLDNNATVDLQHNRIVPYVDPLLQHMPAEGELPSVKLPEIEEIKEDTAIDTAATSDDDTKVNQFHQFRLNERLTTTIFKKLHISVPTTIQRLSIPVLIAPEGHDAMIKSETGSGKTLAYLLPMVHSLLTMHYTTPLDRSSGIYALILTPTRELTLQIEELTRSLLASTAYQLVVSNVMGGEKPKSEKARLRKGANILVATPGRLVYHLQHTAVLDVASHLRWLILDEADRLLELGFERDIQTIVKQLDKQSKTARQNVLVSATLTSAVEQLSTVILNKPVKIGFDIVQQHHHQPSTRSLSSTAVKDEHVMPEDVNGEDDSENDFEVVRDDNADNQPTTNDTLDEYINDIVSGVEQEQKSAEYTLPAQLKHFYVQCDPRHRLVTLAAFLRQQLIASRSNQQEGSFKAIVFCSTCAAVDFYYILMRHTYWPDDDYTVIQRTRQQTAKGDNAEDDDSGDEAENEKLPALLDTPILKLHGNLTQVERSAVYNKFIKAKSGVMLCTDVAARGLDLPAVDWIVQYDAPEQTEEYIHRAGRTARAGKKGSALLFLMPHEMLYLDILNAAGIFPSEMSAGQIMSALRLRNTGAPRVLHEGMSSTGAALQRLFEATVNNATELHERGAIAYSAYIRSYAAYPKPVKHIFNTSQLHLGHVARMFALKDTPREIMNLARRGTMKDKEEKTQRKPRQRTTIDRPIAVAIKTGQTQQQRSQRPGSRTNPLNKPNSILSSEYAA